MPKKLPLSAADFQDTSESEWRVAVATGSAADAFLGTQGDPWDTQWDMATALIGAILALVLLGKVHDRFLAANESGGPPHKPSENQLQS